MQTLSDEIRQARFGAARNPYQGKDKKVLFVCSMGILRSATAARIYAKKYNTRSAGVYEEALVPLTPILMLWADEIVFVNQDAFKYADASGLLDYIGDGAVKVLDIPDQFPHMDPRLIDEFEQQYEVIE